MNNVLSANAIDTQNMNWAGICELTSEEVLLVSGAQDVEDQTTGNGNPVWGVAYSVFFGAAAGGVTGAVNAWYNGASWTHGGVGGMLVGGVGGALNHIKGK